MRSGGGGTGLQVPDRRDSTGALNLLKMRLSRLLGFTSGSVAPQRDSVQLSSGRSPCKGLLGTC